MNDLIIKIFKNKRVLSFVWNNRPCWVAVDIADFFGYMQKSKAILNCINREKFQMGVEYDVLEKELLDDITLDSTYKFLLIKQIYLDAGINLPRYIEEEKF
ncbi:MAG: hypothetical protein ACRC6T_07820 [Sarcina sp.]